jgi:hypothetical protein
MPAMWIGARAKVIRSSVTGDYEEICLDSILRKFCSDSNRVGCWR